MPTSHKRNSRLTCTPLISPNGLRLAQYCSPTLTRRVEGFREEIARVIHREVDRPVIIAGPCSVHNPAEAYAFAEKLATIAARLPKLLIAIRLAGEKPRTDLGWPGYILNPDLDLDSDGDLERGITGYRELLIKVSHLGLPIATEVIDPDLFQYFDDLVSIAWIGARSVTHQTSRYAASGFSMPVLFKNNTNGSIQDAANAVKVASKGGHTFASINDDGIKCRFKSTKEGNPDCAIALRGGEDRSNYDDESINRAAHLSGKRRVFVDVSHANSRKDPTRQASIAREVMESRKRGNPVGGLLIEAYFEKGSQKLRFTGSESVLPGLSVTDGCMGLGELTSLLEELNEG